MLQRTNKFIILFVSKSNRVQLALDCKNKSMKKNSTASCTIATNRFVSRYKRRLSITNPEKAGPGFSFTCPVVFPSSLNIRRTGNRPMKRPMKSYCTYPIHCYVMDTSVKQSQHAATVATKRGFTHSK